MSATSARCTLELLARLAFTLFFGRKAFVVVFQLLRIGRLLDSSSLRRRSARLVSRDLSCSERVSSTLRVCWAAFAAVRVIVPPPLPLRKGLLGLLQRFLRTLLPDLRFFETGYQLVQRQLELRDFTLILVDMPTISAAP